MKLRFFVRSKALLMFVSVLAIPGLSYGLQNDLLPFENLTKDVGRGFGDSWNRYTWSMDEFNGKVYVGTWNVQLDYKAIAEGLKNDFNNQQTVQEVITQLQTAISGISSGSGNILEGIRFITSKGAESGVMTAANIGLKYIKHLKKTPVSA